MGNLNFIGHLNPGLEQDVSPRSELPMQVLVTMKHEGMGHEWTLLPKSFKGEPLDM